MKKYLNSKLKSSNLLEILYKSFHSFSFRVFGFAIGYVFVLIITRNLEAKGKGYYDIIYMLAMLFSMFGKLGIDVSMNKWCGIYNGNNNTNYLKKIYFKSISIALAGSVFLAFLLYVFRFSISAYFKNEALVHGINYIVFLLPFMAILDVNASFFRGLKKIKLFGIYHQVGRFLFPTLVIIILLYKHELNYLSPVIALFFGVIVLSLLAFIHVLYYLNSLTESKEISIPTVKNIVSVSFPMMYASSIIFIMGWIDTFIIGRLDTIDNVGIYATSVKLAVAISFIYNAVSNITTPKIAEFYSLNQTAKINETIKFANRLNVYLAIPIFIVLFIFAEFTLGLFGKEFVEGIRVFRILLIFQLSNTFLGNVSAFMQMTGSQKTLQYFILIGLALNVIISLTLYNSLGLIGVAIGTLIASITWRVLGIVYIYKHNNIKIWFQF